MLDNAGLGRGGDEKDRLIAFHLVRGPDIPKHTPN